jgi:hypothetical protein
MNSSANSSDVAGSDERSESNGSELAWTNSDLPLYHGTDDNAAARIVSEGVDLTKCSPLADFGRGFYTTTNLEQAKNWASLKAKRIRRKQPSARGAVLGMSVDRNWLGKLDSLAFVRSAAEVDYPTFVRFCRSGCSPHRPTGDYQVVYGPVAQWQDIADPNFSLFIIQDCDQISFHNDAVTGPSSILLANVNLIWSEK